jgi:hypothetical protein
MENIHLIKNKDLFRKKELKNNLKSIRKIKEK